MRRFFGLDPPRVTLKPTPFLRRASGDAWQSPSGSSSPSSTSSPISAGQTWAPVNTVANQDDLHELVNKIRFLSSMGSEDRPLILEVCDRASSNTTAREAIRALMHEFKHGSAAAQLSAARLWAILLRNSSAAFIAQSTAADFLEAIEALLASTQTAQVVRHRVLRVLGDAVFSNPAREPFRTLWVKVKPADQPDHGSPYSDHDAILRPSVPSARFNIPSILDRMNPPIPQAHGFDSRFPSEWEAPPPSYETATGTFRSFSERHSASLSVFSDISSDTDGDPSEANEESERWSIVQAVPQVTVSPPRQLPSPLSIPRLQITARQDHIRTTPGTPINISPLASPLSSPESPTPATARPTSIRRLPLIQTNNRSNVLTPSSSRQSPVASRPESTIYCREEGIYTRTYLCLKNLASKRNHFWVLSNLESFREVMRKLDTVSSLVYALKYRQTLVQISTQLEVADDPELKIALTQDQAAVADILLDALYSPADEQAILALHGEGAQNMLDIVQDTLDKALLASREATSKARRLIGKLAKACDKLPSSLIISGVTQRDEHASFSGGFGDVYRAVYDRKPVALKRMRMFLGTDQQEIRRRFCREALVWQRLHHSYIVPLIGIDTESFPSSYCMVSPWMKNGTVIKYLSGIEETKRQRTVDRLIREIAQGLAFLHEQKIVHGDLRGSNILVDDDGHACLTDFGLTVLTDATTTQTNNGAGSVRWMAPEALHPAACGLQDFVRRPASDIYAFGCVCLELYTGYPPFHDAILHDAPVMFQVMDGIRPNRPAGNVISDSTWKIMQKCWSHNFVERPSIIDIVLELGMSQCLSDDATHGDYIDTAVGTTTTLGQEDRRSVSSGSQEHYEGWVASVISPLSGFIDMPINPRHHYLDLQEIADGPGGTTLYVARLADDHREKLKLPNHVKERDQDDLLARRPTFVAIKSIPIMPLGSSKLGEILRELRIMGDLQCDNILKMDALYVDPVEDTLWIRMELMTRTLSSVIELNPAGLVLSDRVIAGCIKDILIALEHLRANGIAPRNIRSDNVLINNHGVLKLTNLSNATRMIAQSRDFPQVDQTSGFRSSMASDASALGALVLEMGAGRRPPLNAQGRLEDWPPLSSVASRNPSFHQFIRMCLDPTIEDFGYQRLIESPFIQDACGRPSLAQLLVQCTAFEGRLRDQGRRK